MNVISSRDNAKIRQILKLKKELSRNSATVFIEGMRLCVEAYQSGIEMETLLLTEGNLDVVPGTMRDSVPEVLLISDEVAGRISSTMSPQGVFAVVRSPVVSGTDDRQAYAGDRLLLCDSIRDPGNMGSIIRSADAFGFDGVVFTADSADPFNEKVIRSSMGSVFHIRLIQTQSLRQTVDTLHSAGFSVYSTDLAGEDIGHRFRFDRPCAIIVGNEAHGVGEELSGMADHTVRIPMAGKAESLNVASAAAVLCYISGLS
ncbi:MAG: TrmH family RNA methyltransferase [Saccharofermentanales bacterium]